MSEQASPQQSESDGTVLIAYDGSDHAKAAIIAIGSHGRTGLDRVVMGSVANAVVQHSNLPVFIARVD